MPIRSARSLILPFCLRSYLPSSRTVVGKPFTSRLTLSVTSFPLTIQTLNCVRSMFTVLSSFATRPKSHLASFWPTCRRNMKQPAHTAYPKCSSFSNTTFTFLLCSTRRHPILVVNTQFRFSHRLISIVLVMTLPLTRRTRLLQRSTNTLTQYACRLYSQLLQSEKTIACEACTSLSVITVFFAVFSSNHFDVITLTRANQRLQAALLLVSNLPVQNQS